VFSWFKTKAKKIVQPGLVTDVHSHLLPGLDDGVRSFEQAEEIILRFHALGYKKVITTPHVMSDTYRNTSAVILKKLEELKAHLITKNIAITVEAAAEYYLDEELFRKLESGEHLLTFGQQYLLFETNFLTEPFNLKEFIFLASTRGFKPVLAHPERYLYLQQNFAKMEDLLNRGVLFQLNTSSFSGYYSKQVQTTANKLVERKWVHLLGSDCHHIHHINLLENALSLKYFQKALSLPLLNTTL
jgi:protein-tyrosine phosphatase